MDISRYFRRKSLEHVEELAKKQDLHRSLGALDLTMLGVGAIVGTGLFVLTGVAAARYAGPGVVLSFTVAGITATFAALVYAELAAMVPISGSAYTYAYVALGELIAWIIGWDLILEYTVAAGAVAIGWGGYVMDLFASIGVPIPRALVAPPGAGGVVNLPGILIVAVVVSLLVRGSRESASVNTVIVFIKLGVVLVFIAVASTLIKPALWRPFTPFGATGIVHGAAIIFFAYIGFDAVSTAAEEVKKPARDLPIGILASLVISTVLYIAVSGLLTGIVKYSSLNTASPLAFALLTNGVRWGSLLISVGSLAGLSSVLIVSVFGQTRVFFAMARDGLLPPIFATLHRRFRTPYLDTFITGTAVALIAGFLPVQVVAELANIGTLAAFVLVGAGVIVLRYTNPDVPRPFKTPLFPVVPILTMGSSIYLMTNLPRVTWIRFVVWLVIGLTLYFLYGSRHSHVDKPASELPEPRIGSGSRAAD